MSIFDIFRRDKQDEISESYDTPAPDAPSGQGQLDTKSETWVFIQSTLTQTLADMREKNDSAKLDVLATAELRGQIKMVKRLLALGITRADKRRQSSVDDD